MDADIKSENVTGWAGMWFRIDAKNSRNSLAFDNMQDRPIKANYGLEAMSDRTLMLPADAGVTYGVLLDGEGKVWFGNVSFEIVGDSVPLTGMDMNPNIPNLLKIWISVNRIPCLETDRAESVASARSGVFSR